MEHSTLIVAKKNTSVEQRRSIYEALLQGSVSGELQRGAISTVASQFSVSNRTVRRIWQHAKSQVDLGLPVDVSSNTPMVVGRKRVQVNLNRVLDIPWIIIFILYLNDSSVALYLFVMKKVWNVFSCDEQTDLI